MERAKKRERNERVGKSERVDDPGGEDLFYFSKSENLVKLEKGVKE